MPNKPDHETQLGIIAHSKGLLDLAVTHYESALKRNPRDVAALSWLATILAQRRQFDRAIELFDSALRLEPKNLDAALNLSNCLFESGAFERAHSAYKDLLCRGVKVESVHIGLCASLSAMSDHAGALRAARQGLELHPQSVQLHAQEVNSLLEVGSLPEAEVLITHYLELFPTSFSLRLLNLRLMVIRGESDTALSGLVKLQGAFPNNCELFVELGNVYQKLNRIEDAESAYRRCLDIDSSNALARWNLAHILLREKRFGEGWEFLQYRWGTKHFKSLQTAFSRPRWDGVKTDKVIKIIGEQGIGDQLLYASMALEILQAYPNAFLYVSQKLAALYQSGPLSAQVKSFEEFDASGDFYYIYAADLGGLVRPSEDKFPERSITPDVLRWSPKIAIDQFLEGIRLTSPSPLIGLSWSSENPNLGSQKSPPIDLIVKIASEVPGNFINIQYGETAGAISQVMAETGKKVSTVDGLDLFGDLVGLAYLISKLDFVITISNTNAHLSGSLGITTVLLLPPKGPGKFWYWHTRGDTDTSLWYPSVHVVDFDPNSGWSGSANKAIKFFAHKGGVRPA